MTASAKGKPGCSSLWPHRLAVAALGSGFALVFVGGLVTTYKAGLAVPDWPTTFGYSMITYPLTQWLYGPWQVFIEHGHRLLGLWVGLLTVLLAGGLWWKEQRKGVKVLGLLALVLVVFQGTLGGMRVIYRAQPLALIHGCVAPVFLALLAALVVLTQPVRLGRTFREPVPPKVLSTAVLLVGLIYGQIVLGAVLRHFPEYATWRQFSAVLMFHLMVALLVLGHALALLWFAYRVPECRPLRLRAWVLTGLVMVQLILGPATWIHKYAFPSFLAHTDWAQVHLNVAYSGPQVLITTTHVLVGSVLLAAGVMFGLHVWQSQQASVPELRLQGCSVALKPKRKIALETIGCVKP